MLGRGGAVRRGYVRAWNVGLANQRLQKIEDEFEDEDDLIAITPSWERPKVAQASSL